MWSCDQNNEKFKLTLYHGYNYYNPVYNIIDYYSPMCYGISYYSSICNNIDYYSLVSNNIGYYSQMTCVIILIITDWYILQLNNTVKFVMTLIITYWFVIRLYITVQCVIALIVSLYNFTSLCLDTEVHFFSWSCIWYGRYVGRFENLINKAWKSRQCQMIALVNGWIIIVVVF